MPRTANPRYALMLGMALVVLLASLSSSLAQDRGPQQPPPSNAPPEGAHGAEQAPPDTGPEEPVDQPATLAEADELLITGDYDLAAETYRRLSREPDHAAEARIGLATVLMRTGEYKEAIDLLTTRLPAEPPPTAARRHYLLAQLLRITGRYEDSIAHAREALELHPDLAGARRLLGETLETLGRRDQAIETYRWFDRQLVERENLPRDAEWITKAAMGFLRYSVLTQNNVPRRTQHVLQNMLQVAYEQLDRTYWPARIAAAELLREKFNNDEEDGSVSDYHAALRINNKLCEAHVGLGRVALEAWDFETIEGHADHALDVNPNHLPAIHLLADKLVTERRYEQAIAMCERALVINDRDLTALSIKAAAAACRYDDATVTASRKRVAAINPRYALFHRAVGDALGGIRQYPMAEKQYLKAIEYDPTDANARTELGMLYMQWGLEDKARIALDGAWALDPFNKRTKFTLDLLDSLADFDRHETAHFLIRYDAARDPGLGAYLADCVEEVYDEVVADYATAPDVKTILEIFPTQRSFSVRITGKPWIPTVGACTGTVIALASPRKDPQLGGTYDIANVIKHEFTHTVTLAATHNRIPHWFTEGLAVSQEGNPRSFRWCELLADAVRRDSLFTLQSVNWAFMRPRHRNDKTIAYAQSEWMCEYIIERFGYDSINTMLRRFKDGRTQRDVFVELLGIEPAEFDRDFHAWAKEHASKWGFDMSPPEDVEALRAAVADASDDAALIGRLARAEFDHDKFENAKEAAERALELDENEPNALEILAKVFVFYAERDMMGLARDEYFDKALPLLERLWEVSPTGWTAPKYLALIALANDDPDRAFEPLKRLQRLCPRDPLSWRGLSGIYLKRGDDEQAMQQLLELVRIEENDSEVRAHVASIYKRRGQLREAQFWYRRALFINPSDTDLHEALGDTSMQVGDNATALREHKMSTALEPGEPRHYEKAAIAAHKLGDATEAKRLAARAVELDPTSSAKALLP